MPADLLSRYFRSLRRGRRYRIHPVLIEGITWGCRRTENPLSGHMYDLILLRNGVLTYYEPPQQTRVLRKVLACLRPGGTFVIGSQEKFPVSLTDMVPASVSCPDVFRKTPEN